MEFVAGSSTISYVLVRNGGGELELELPRGLSIPFNKSNTNDQGIRSNRIQSWKDQPRDRRPTQEPRSIRCSLFQRVAPQKETILNGFWSPSRRHRRTPCGKARPLRRGGSKGSNKGEEEEPEERMLFLPPPFPSASVDWVIIFIGRNQWRFRMFYFRLIEISRRKKGKKIISFDFRCRYILISFHWLKYLTLC